MRKTFILLLLFLVGGLQVVQAQKMVLKFVNGEIVKYNINELESIWIEDAGTIIDDGYEYVDLGLPSGTLWATCNVGATAPEEFGYYFAWGEVQRKSEYNWETYKFVGEEIRLEEDGESFEAHSVTKYCTDALSEYAYNGLTDNLTELQPEDDAATVFWGSNWQTPSFEQWLELLDDNYTTCEWTALFGVAGVKVKSKNNGKSIFIPAAGWRQKTDSYSGECVYWSRTLSADYGDCAYAMYMWGSMGSSIGGSIGGGTTFKSDWEDEDRYHGEPIRPVRKQ